MSMHQSGFCPFAKPVVIIGAACVLASNAAGQLATMMMPSQDNTLYQSNSGQQLSNALGEFLYIGMTSRTERRRALLKVPIESIPAEASITQVALHIFVDRGFGTASPVTLHRLTSGWGQGTSNAGNPGGTGTSATPGDPTWTFSHFNSTPWTTPGGDFVALPSSEVIVEDPEVLYTFASTPELIADLEFWRANPAQNFGWVILGDELMPGSALRLHSSEGLSAPVLTVVYSLPPTCGTSDFDGDGDFGTDFDIEAFFACLAGNCCATCFPGGSDFNMDGDTGTDADIEAFFRVLAGGEC